MWQVTVWRGGNKPPVPVATLWARRDAEALKLQRESEAPALWWFLRRIAKPC